MRRVSSRAPSPALVISVIALFVSIGGIGYAAATIGTNDIKRGAVTANKLHKSAVTTKKIKDGAVNGNKVRDNSLTGGDIQAPEAYHEIGADGEPVFQNGANNFGEGFSTAAFFLDREGIVHLKGTVTAPTFAVIFTLPDGYRPSQQLFIPTVATSVASSIFIQPNGDVQVRGGPGATNNYTLDSITFRAG
jgi:hypothetical protein